MTSIELLASLPQPHVLLRPLRDEDGGIADFAYASANPAACAFYGRAADALVGRTMLEIHPNLVTSELLDIYRRIAEGGESLFIEDWPYAQDLLGGEIRYYDVQAVRSDGCVSAMWIDVTDRHRAIEALAESEAQARRRQAETQAIFDSQLDPFVRFANVYDESGAVVDLRFVDVNLAAAAYNNLTVDDMVGMRFLELYPNLMENGPMADYLRCATDGTPVVLDDYFYPNEVLGSERRYDIRAVRIDGGVALTWRDVTERYRDIERIRVSEQRYRLLSDNTSDVIWQVGADGLVQWASESTRAVLGYAVDEVIGTVAVEYIHPDDVARAVAARSRVLDGAEIRQRFRVRRADGTHDWMGFVARPLPLPDGTVARVVALHDIAAEVAAREQLEKAVGRDPLTGLMSRDAMESAIAEALARNHPEAVSLLCVGLDSLSTINDAFGHASGDVVLATTAARIVVEAGDADIVGRGSGVDFLVLVAADTDGAADPGALGERIRLAAKDPVDVGRQAVQPSVSIGIATAGEGMAAGELVRAATIAMRAAKENGRDRLAYSSPDQAARAERRVTLVTEVETALSEGRIVPWFQPVHDLVTGDRLGYEALARWLRDDGTVVEPRGFLPVVESTALIRALDAAMLAGSVAVLPGLPDGQFVSVNVSPRSLADPEYVDEALAILGRSAGVASRLHMEVTETALLDDSSPVVDAMRRFAAMGARWYVDDFGTGFSSISHLRDLPVSGLKLDVSFTAGIGRREERSIRLAQALAGLAEGLGLDTIAEGVETSEQAATLTGQGWRLGQGWLYGRAAPL